MKKLLLMMFVVAPLAGCGAGSWLGGGASNVEPPQPLEPIKSSITIDKLWSKDLGAASHDPHSTLVPALGASRVFVSDAKGQVTAVDAKTGERVWQHELKQHVSGGVGLGDGLVLVATSEGEVIALDEGSGEPRWTSSVSSEVLAPPQGAGGMVVVRSVDGKISGLSASDGARRWIYERGVPSLTLRGAAAPAIYKGAVFAGFASGKVAANALDSGRVLWEASVGLPRGRNEIERLVDVDAQPLVSEGVLYAAAYQSKLVALDLASGRLLWTRDVSTYSNLAVDESNVYLSDDQDQVVALDRRSGATVWQQDKLKHRRLTGPVVAGGYVAVVDFEGNLHVMSRDDGRLVGRARVAGKSGVATPVSDGDTLYLLERDGTLSAVTLGR
jgi:outer membrane protein assembly factor BamB